MSATLRILVTTPLGEHVVEDVIYLRLDGPDGYRGVQPGHEPALTVVRPGALTVESAGDAPGESFLATEGGFAWIRGGEVRIVTRWAARAEDLDQLLDQLRERFHRRAYVERDVRGQLQRYDAATRRALVGLQREVTR